MEDVLLCDYIKGQYIHVQVYGRGYTEYRERPDLISVITVDEYPYTVTLPGHVPTFTELVKFCFMFLVYGGDSQLRPKRRKELLRILETEYEVESRDSIRGAIKDHMTTELVEYDGGFYQLRTVRSIVGGNLDILSRYTMIVDGGADNRNYNRLNYSLSHITDQDTLMATDQAIIKEFLALGYPNKGKRETPVRNAKPYWCSTCGKHSVMDKENGPWCCEQPRLTPSTEKRISDEMPA